MRLQIRLGGIAEDLFKKLVDLFDAPPREIVIDAIALYDFAAREIREGRKVGSFDPKTQTFQAMTTPILESLSHRSVHASSR